MSDKQIEEGARMLFRRGVRRALANRTFDITLGDPHTIVKQIGGCLLS